MAQAWLLPRVRLVQCGAGREGVPCLEGRQPMELEVPQRTAASGLRRSNNELLDGLLEAIRKKQSAPAGSTGKRGGRLRRQPNTRQAAAEASPQHCPLPTQAYQPLPSRQATLIMPTPGPGPAMHRP